MRRNTTWHARNSAYIPDERDDEREDSAASEPKIENLHVAEHMSEENEHFSSVAGRTNQHRRVIPVNNFLRDITEQSKRSIVAQKL